MKVISKNSNKYICNEGIRAREVRTINFDGEQLGILNTTEVLRLAEENDMDAVLISPNAKPPVCKIMNLNKFIYEQSKKEKLAKKNQKKIDIKEIRLSATIEKHDIQIKANRAEKFLLAEDKVKVTVRFRGRQSDYVFIGRNVLNSFISELGDVYLIEKRAKLEGRNMTMVLAPKKA